MKPILVIKNLKTTGFIKLIGKENAHIKFNILNQLTGKNMECLGFKLGKFELDFRSKTFDLAFTLDENHWRGNVTYFLNIRDVKFH